MMFEYRDYQIATRNYAVQRIREGTRRIVFFAPTGTGKSLAIIATRDGLREELNLRPLIVTPRVEIIRGFLQKQGVNTAPLNDTQIAEMGLEFGITTPIRALNRIGTPEMDFDTLIIDEGHHSMSSSYRQLMQFAGVLLCFTASPFRGTPRGTELFNEFWGEVVPIISYQEAIDRGYYSLPAVSLLPLCDDDKITADLSAGEFKVSSASHLVSGRLEQIVNATGRAQWDAPTMYAFPSREIIKEATAEFARRGFPTVSVTGDTKDREALFRDVVECRAALLQISVVSEGVDLPLRRLVDCCPTMSPVRWVQLFGRITRPGGGAEYICTNRNLERHAYILSGVLPRTAVGEAQAAFGGPTKRSGIRVIGLEGLGRFKPAPMPLADGSVGAIFSLQRPEEGAKMRQWVVMVHPAESAPIVATRVNGRDGKTWGKWERGENLPVVEGAVASTPSGKLTEKMAAWWTRSAAAFGLDATPPDSRKSFQVLPILCDIGARFI